MRISDWSSDVCSSDLADAEHVSGRVLLRKGVCLTDDHLRIFRQWGVTAVDIEGVAARPGVEAELEQRDPERLARLRECLQLRFRNSDLQQPVIAELMRRSAERRGGKGGGRTVRYW